MTPPLLFRLFNRGNSSRRFRSTLRDGTGGDEFRIQAPQCRIVERDADRFAALQFECGGSFESNLYGGTLGKSLDHSSRGLETVLGSLRRADVLDPGVAHQRSKWWPIASGKMQSKLPDRRQRGEVHHHRLNWRSVGLVT